MQGILGRGAVSLHVPAQLSRLQAIALLEERVEAAQAAEAAGKGHVGHRQGRIGEQPLGEQQALGLCKFHRRDAELGAEGAPQVPIGNAQSPRHGFQAAVFQRAVFDQPRRGLSEARGRVHAGIAGRQLRPAAQAGPVPGGLGGRRARVEAAVLASRRLHRAHRAAVDPGRGHRDEEAPVEARVARAQRAVAGVGIERHGGSIPASRRRR